LRASINETYDETYYGAREPDYYLDDTDLLDGETYADAERRVLAKAAECLRDGGSVTLTRGELELVRHMMPARVVHQSYAKRWVLDRYGVGG
jgi:hypothetical protein